MSNLLQRVDDAADQWLGLQITKRMLLFDPQCNVKVPDFRGLTSDKLISKLKDVVIQSVIRPRISKRSIRQSDLNALLINTEGCNTLEQLSRILARCPTTNTLLLKDAASSSQKCPSCGTSTLQHLTPADGDSLESFFQDHQIFLFFFERVAELLIERKKNDHYEIRQFLQELIHGSRLRIS